MLRPGLAGLETPSRDTWPMTSENLDVVRSIYLGSERGDFNSAAWADPDIEYLVVDGPEPSCWNGLAGMAEGWRDWLRAWEDFRAEPEEYIDLGDERILVLVRNSGRGRVSGLELEGLGPRARLAGHCERATTERLTAAADDG